MQNKLQLLTTAELMDLIQVSRGTLTNWRKEGLPFHKVGRLVRFNQEEVFEWLEGKTGNNSVEDVQKMKDQLKELDKLLIEAMEQPEDLLECETFIYEVDKKILSGVKLTDDELEKYKTVLLGLNNYNFNGIDKVNDKVNIINKAKEEITENKKPIDMNEVNKQLLQIDLRNS